MNRTIMLLIFSFLISCNGNMTTVDENKAEENSTNMTETDEESSTSSVKSDESIPVNQAPLLADDKQKYSKLLSKNGSIKYYFSMNDVYYFYVMNNGLLGVFNQYAEQIIPIQFDKIYNLNSFRENCFVVEKNKTRGLYGLDGKKLIACEYDGIYPVKDENILAQIKKGNKFGYIDLEGKEHFNSSDNSKLCQSPFDSKLILNWKTQKNKIGLFDKDDDDFVIYFTPSYIFDLGIMDESYFLSASEATIHDGIFTVDSEIKEVKTFGGKLKALLSEFIESGASPRDDYVDNVKKLTVINENMKSTSTIILKINRSYSEFGFDNSSYQFINNEIIEVIDYDSQSYPFHSLPTFDYYKISGNGNLEKLESVRFYDFTKFVKINENYFKISSNEEPQWDEETGGSVIIYDHLTIKDLDVMRNEIFAEYGYKFKSQEWHDFFSKFDWYKPIYDNVDEQLTEIDKYNIEVILRMKKEMKGNEEKFTGKRKEPYIAAG